MKLQQWESIFDDCWGPERVANQSARPFVQARADFIGSNTAGGRQNGRYVVYSYGVHFPMFVHDPGSGRWYENGDRYSVSTSKQFNQMHPHAKTTELTTSQLTLLIVQGEEALVRALVA